MRRGRVAVLLSLIAFSRLAAGEPRWERASPAGAAIVALARAPGSAEVLYAATRRAAVMRSFDGGRHWTRARAPIAGEAVQQLLVSAARPRTLFAVATSGSLWRSENAAHSWVRVLPG